MRWLFLFVLSVNLAYIAWQVNSSSSASYSDVQPLRNVPAIVLLAESDIQNEASPEVTENATLEAIEELAESDAKKIEATGDSQSLAVESVAKVETMSVALKIPAAKEPAPKPPASKPPEPKLPEPKQQAPKLPTPKETTAKEAVTNEAGPVPADRCYTLGPFRDLDQLRALTKEIKSYVVSTDFRGREVKEQSLYWVNIKPEKTRKKAIAVGERLKKKKIKDFYVIREGENINGISLGYYRNKVGAEGLVKKVRKLGFDVVMEPVFKTYTVYWLDYRVASGELVPESLINKYIKETKKDSVERKLAQCS